MVKPFKPRIVPGTGTGPGFTPPDDVAKLAAAKLHESGLTLDDAKVLKITYHNATWAQTAGFENLPILRIPYFVPDYSRAPLRPRPDWPEFLRVRYLREPSPKPDGWGKYSQPKQTGVAAYFPLWGEIDWEATRANFETEIIITEGELKAASACKHLKLPTIGLGGVWNFRSVGADTGFLPELRGFTWARRRVTIIYDSDLQNPEKHEIRKALQELGAELTRRGALPQYLKVPDLLDGKGKTGLDDYIMAKGAEHVIEGIAKNAMSFGLSEPLWDMNDRYVIVRKPACIARIGYSEPIKIEHLKTIEAVSYDHRDFRPNGTPFLTSMQAAEFWPKWAMRGVVEDMTYDPSAQPLAKINGGSQYNTWPGWGAEAVPGDVTLFNKLIDHVFQGAKPEERLWFMRWLAYPVRHPGTKLFTSAVIHGINQGTGKSLIGYTMKSIYGENFTEISQGDLQGNFNEWARCKQFIMGDDVTGNHPQESLDKLKKLITQREVRINAKHLPSYSVPDTINYYFTSNHANALFLEDQDRRFFVHEVRSKPIPEAFGVEWGPAYRKWLEEGGGASAIHAYLRVFDMGDFDPSAPALATTAKEQMRREARSDVGNWCRDLRDNPDEMLTTGDPSSSNGVDPRLYGDLFTCDQLFQAYKYFAKDDATKITANRIGREMAKAGMRKVRDGAMIRITDRKPDRYFAVRNGEQWLNATLKQVQDHILNPQGTKPDDSWTKAKPKGKTGAKF